MSTACYDFEHFLVMAAMRLVGTTDGEKQERYNAN